MKPNPEVNLPRLICDYHMVVVDKGYNWGLPNLKNTPPREPFSDESFALLQAHETFGPRSLETFFTIARRTDFTEFPPQNMEAVITPRRPLLNSFQDVLTDPRAVIDRIRAERQRIDQFKLSTRGNPEAEKYIRDWKPTSGTVAAFELYRKAGGRITIATATLDTALSALIRNLEVYGLSQFLDPEYPLIVRKATLPDGFWPQVNIGAIGMKPGVVEFFKRIEAPSMPVLIEDAVEAQGFASLRQGCETFNPYGRRILNRQIDDFMKANGLLANEALPNMHFGYNVAKAVQTLLARAK